MDKDLILTNAKKTLYRIAGRDQRNFDKENYDKIIEKIRELKYYDDA